MATFSSLKNLVDAVERKVHVPWVMVKGCCNLEVENASTATYDWTRLGVENVAQHPSEADVMIVGGWVDAQFVEELKSAYFQLSGIRAVIAVGACALSGAPYAASGEKILKISDVLPVDVFVPGCPPRPEAVLEAIQALRNKQKPQMDQKKVIYEALKGPNRN
ncbi:MAG: NADH-quinone oxidoreductase subunit B [Bdellovibrionales bacterium]